MSDKGVVDWAQVELFSPLQTLSWGGLKLMGLLPFTGASLYGSFGSTSRRSLTSTSLPRGFASLDDPQAFGSDDWWAALVDNHLKEDFCHFEDEAIGS